MIHVDQLISTIRAELPRFEALGFINNSSLYQKVFWALNNLGNTATEYDEEIIEVKNGQAELPKGFKALVVAFKCDPLGYTVKDKKKGIPIPQLEYGFIERTERGFRWDSCDECCATEFESCITETLFIYQNEIDFHYRNPTLLTLGKSIRRDKCYEKYRKQYFNTSPEIINIDGANRLYASFDGFIYLIYKRTPIDEKGKPMIPETQLGYVQQYIYHTIRHTIFETAFLNGDDPNLQGKVNEEFALRQYYLDKAMTELKMSTLSPRSYLRIQERNNKRFQVFDSMLPRVHNGELKILID